jgi:hypothetical protein
LPARPFQTNFSPTEGYVVKRLIEMGPVPRRMTIVAAELDVQAVTVREHVRRAMAKRGYCSAANVDTFLAAVKEELKTR